MTKIRITKEFKFEMSHALQNYDGKCKHIHGHSYILQITVIGTPITDENNPKLGMVIDFGVLKNIIQKHIIDHFDHALVLRKGAQLSEEIESSYGNVKVVDYQPTCENMIANFANILQPLLPSDVKLHHLKLHETASSFAEWFASDNLK